VIFFTSLLFSLTDKSDQRVELKRLEHERQRLLQRKLFEDQMRALEQKQAQELLSIPSYESNGNGGVQHLAASAPTTPPRVNTQLGEAFSSLVRKHLLTPTFCPNSCRNCSR
jgi:hypothetical protein